MAHPEPKREQLLKRRDEINEQLSRLRGDLQIELDNDPEEQAIQIEQDEVAITRENHLRRELADVEDRLLQMDADA
jgi:RNA polymerase-binding transcription factor DksA